MKNFLKLGAALTLVLALFVGGINNATALNKDLENNESNDSSIPKIRTAITDKEEIQQFIKEQGLDTDPEEIEKIIYIPLNVNWEEQSDIKEESLKNDDNITLLKEFGKNEYYTKIISGSEKKGKLLRSSWFEAPGGTMTVKESLECDVSFEGQAGVEADMKIIKAKLTTSLGFDVKKSISFSETQKISVRKGYKRNLKAYINNIEYKYQLWEKDLIFDDFLGVGVLKKPIGIYFQIGKEIKK